MKGKLIVIEGTDCSGKETQTKLLIEKLNKDNIECIRFSFPDYPTPTGKIVGGPYLGKKDICEGYFEEGASHVDPKVSSLYYAADRKYNISKIEDLLKSGVNVILDRYTYSNMAHQGGKIEKKEQRYRMYEWIEKLEFDLLELPKCDIGIFLHMPTEAAKRLKKNREYLDQNEQDQNHLNNAEKAYMEITSKYDFYKIECVSNDVIKSIDSINNELYDYILSQLKICNNRGKVL